MDRLDALAVFVAILDAGSLAAAARRLRRSPPAVTRVLAALEDQLGTRLIERTTRRLAATEAGRLLADRARRVLADVEEAMRPQDRATALGGSLRITAPLLFGRLHIAPLVSDFLAAHPALHIELLLHDRYVDLIEEGIDVALRIGTLPDSSLVARRVGQVRRVMVASPGYLAVRGAPQRPQDLTRHDVIFTAGSSAPQEWRFHNGTRSKLIPLTPRLTVNQVDTALIAARAGRGIVRVLSYQVAEDLEAGRLVRLLSEFETPALPVQLVVPSARHMATTLRGFLDFATPRLAALPVLRIG